MNSDIFAAITGCKYCLQFYGTAIICLQFEQGLLFYYDQIYQLNGLLIGKFSLITMNIKKNNFYCVVLSHFVFFADYIYRGSSLYGYLINQPIRRNDKSRN